ncbi:hypothetical protein K438DRAFT_1805146 [Mycena galopus ATCC 62051]|nr:hypothetical protein K438DRAFT_1805146 [Mycena galopus ATCC 62051]
MPSPRRPPRPRSPVSMYVSYDTPPTKPPKPLIKLENKRMSSPQVADGPPENRLGHDSDRPSPTSTAGCTPSPTAPCSSLLPFLSLRRKKSRPIRPTLSPPCITPTGEWAEPSRRTPVAPAVDLDEVVVRPCDDFVSAAWRRLGKGKAPAIDLGSDCESDDDISEAPARLRISSHTYCGAQTEEVEKVPRPSFDNEKCYTDDVYPQRLSSILGPMEFRPPSSMLIFHPGSESQTSLSNADSDRDDVSVAPELETPSSSLYSIHDEDVAATGTNLDAEPIYPPVALITTLAV